MATLIMNCVITTMYGKECVYANDSIETEQILKGNEDIVSKTIMQNGLYDGGKVQEFDSFMEGVDAVHGLIELNSLANRSITENDVYVDNCVIVKTEQDIAFDTSDVLAAIRYEQTYYIQYETAQDAQDAINAFEEYPTVEYVIADEYIIDEERYLTAADSSTYEDANGYEHLSWGVVDMQADVFADYVSENSDGTVYVAVLDTGIDSSHSFLQGRIAYGYDFVNGDYTPEDTNGYGTYLAGIIADCTQGLDVKIVPVKILDSSGGTTISRYEEGIAYAMHHADVMLLTYSAENNGESHEALNPLIDTAYSNGQMVVTSSGDWDVDTSDLCPVHQRDIIVTAAVDSMHQKFVNSNYGMEVDVTAPGVNIKSCVPANIISSGYATSSSTDAAAAHVASCAAMLKLLYPNISQAQIENMLEVCALDIGSSGYDTVYGYGIPILSELIEYSPFSDVPTNAYYYNAVYELYLRGYMTGSADHGYFAPLAPMKRQDVAVLFYHMAGNPAVTYRDIYPDVASDAYYANASVWAYDNGVMTGWQDGRFGVGANIIRRDFAVVLYHYAEQIGMIVSETTDISGYTDAADVSSYAETAVKWAVATGIMGQGGTALNPLADISRAEIAVMIYGFIRNHNL